MCKLLKQHWKGWVLGFVGGIAFSFMCLIVSGASARSIRMQDMNTMTWFFVVVGAIIILLQVIPAGLLFFSFITGVYKKERARAKEEAYAIEKDRLDRNNWVHLG